MCLVKILLKTYKTCPVNNKKVICCFANALQYNKPTLYGYIHSQEPNVIKSHLIDFAGKNTIIKKTIKLSCCVEVTSGNSHHFIEAEGSLQCSSCYNVICQFCSGSYSEPLKKGTDTSNVLYFFCYRGDNNDDEIVEETTMRKEFGGLSCPNTCNRHI